MDNWEKQPDEFLFPTRDELKQTLIPPVTPPEKRRPNHILRMQLLLCGLALLGLLAGRQFGLDFFEKGREAYREVMSRGTDFSAGEELVRFANSLPDRVQEKFSPLTGAGGAASEGEGVPQGYSEEPCLPGFAMQLPLEAYRITSPYGRRSHPVTGKSDFHTGLDLAAAEGTAIRPTAGGVVVKSARGRSYGNYLTILHRDGIATRYCHMQYVFVRPGELVGPDTVLGTVGRTGMATGPHLHLELLTGGIGHDPAPALGLP